MSRIRSEQPLVPSVLDRLLDDAPEATWETPRERGQVLRELKLSVRRDLENLLNTRRRPLTPPIGLKELKQSLAEYGLPDFLGLSLGSPREREEFCRTLEKMLRQYEPRFKTVRVQLLTTEEPLDRTLRFRVDALLHADPAPEPVVFDSVLEPVTGVFAVKGTGR